MTEEHTDVTNAEIADLIRVGEENISKHYDEELPETRLTVRLAREIRRLRALDYDKVLEDIATLRKVVGLPNCALPISPRAAMHEAISAVAQRRS